MGSWFTLIVCAAWINLSYAQSAGQDGSECNKLEQLIYRQAQDLASMMMDIKILIMISSRQEERMAEIESQIANTETNVKTGVTNVQTRMGNMETKLASINTEVRNVKTEMRNVKAEVTNKVQTKMAKIENQMTNVTAQIVLVQAGVQETVMQLGPGNITIQTYYRINVRQHHEHNKTYI